MNICELVSYNNRVPQMTTSETHVIVNDEKLATNYAIFAKLYSPIAKISLISIHIVLTILDETLVPPIFVIYSTL